MWVTAWADNKTEYDVIEKKVQQKKKTEQISHRKKSKIEILYFSWNDLLYVPQNFVQLPLAITLSAQVTYLPTLAMLPLLIP